MLVRMFYVSMLFNVFFRQFRQTADAMAKSKQNSARSSWWNAEVIDHRPNWILSLQITFQLCNKGIPKNSFFTMQTETTSTRNVSVLIASSRSRVSCCILFYYLNFAALLQLSLLFPLTIFLARYVQKKTLV